ncbi:MAG: sigma 54-interacting transcriptional regulator [Planctomycetaceae bacterium]|nr:sigma 54-interacting transcriptional regulator [Planctomycetaceae bacterium]
MSAAAVGAVTYCLLVMWYVATFPDVGIRCLLPETLNSPLLVTQFVNEDEDCKPIPVEAGHELVDFGRQPTPNFLAFVNALSDLRSTPIPVQLSPGSDPADNSPQHVPALVEVLPAESDGLPRRMVEVGIRKPTSEAPELRHRIYVTIKAVRLSEFGLTVLWFVCQLVILSVALTAWWQRPADRVARIFCLMCCVSLAAFVAGFHWWALASSPLLNLPFIFAACLLPAVTLHFFCSFPRENALLHGRRVLGAVLIYTPAAAAAALIALTYTAAWILNSLPEAGELCIRMLCTLRVCVYSAIGLSAVYFALIVVSLVASLVRTQTLMERRQTRDILIASVVSAVPIVYTLYLAFFSKTEFALGNARVPMFLASALFMAAYAHGMLRHRLILADETLFRGREYFIVSAGVTLGCAVLLAVGAVATRVYALPKDAPITLQFSLFLILVIAIGFVLWARDRMQYVVDQRFFSEKYQLDKTLKQLNHASGYLADPSVLAEITLATCRDVLDASTASMYVRDASGAFRLIGTSEESSVPTTLPGDVFPDSEVFESVIRRSGSHAAGQRDEIPGIQMLMSELSAELLCVLRSERGIDGLVALGTRSSGVAFSPEDIAFLQAIGQMTVLALHSSRANQNLARLNAELKVKVDRIAEQQRQLSILRAELTSLQTQSGNEQGSDSIPGLDRGEIRGNSREILNVLAIVQKAAATTSTVLLRGESGTGKELLARVVHRNSKRSQKPLICVNCAALAPSLLESELFGHVRGAFTGATSDKEGRFQAADGGTLFLDEIGDISQETQVKLLRVLQERCFEPVGSSSSVSVDVRLIAATNRNLEDMIAAGTFREDLFYRLNVVSITLPPLRDRQEDLIELVFYFLNRAAQKTGKLIRQIDPDALSAIELHRWPGNIRELENVIERAVVLADGDTIMLKDLPAEVRDPQVSFRGTSRTVPVIAETRLPKRPSNAVPPGTRSRTTVLTDHPTTVPARSEKTSRREAERRTILTALESADGNKAEAARQLGMPRSTFYSRLRRLGIDAP